MGKVESRSIKRGARDNNVTGMKQANVLFGDLESPLKTRHNRRHAVGGFEFRTYPTNGAGARGDSLSRTASAAYRRASRMSSCCRSGYVRRTSASLVPSAIIPTTEPTGMRNPRTQGTPPIWSGPTVVPVYVTASTSLASHRAHASLTGHPLQCQSNRTFTGSAPDTTSPQPDRSRQASPPSG